MAGLKTTYLANKDLEHNLGKTAFTMPTGCYLALFTVAPTIAGGGTEVTGSGYARQAVTFGAAASGAIANDNLIAFPVVTSSGYTVKGLYAAIMDASTGGNMLYLVSYNGGSDIAYAVNDQATIPIGDLDITEA